MALSSIATAGSYKNSKLKHVVDVEMDKKGKFNYVLIKVHDPAEDREFKHIVRGFSKYKTHGDIFDEVATNIEARGLDLECVGGGMIHHEPSKKSIKIHGHSEQYGRADHSITHAIIQRKYGSEYDIKVSNL